MAKSKKSETSRQTDVSPEQPVEQPEIGYKVGQWAGHTQYKCKECAFDTLELDVMLDHLLKAHSVIALDKPQTFPPSPQSTEPGGDDRERADGVFEIDLKEDQ
jgi:hypothetical protein